MKFARLGILLFAFIATSLAFARSSADMPLAYWPEVVTLTGTLLEERYGPDSPPADQGKSGWILRLDQPIRVAAKAGEDIETEENNVSEVHLLFDPGNYHFLPNFALLGKRVEATGTLHHRVTLHHLRPILMRVSQISAERATTGEPNQAMQLTASKLAIYASSVCPRKRMLRFMHRGLAAADLVSR